MAVPVVIKLQVEGGRVVASELRGIGEAGDRSLKQIDTSARRASQELRDVGVSAGGLRTAMAGLGTVIAGAFSIDAARRIIEVGDAYQMMQNRIALAAGGADQASAAQAKLLSIAQETRAPLADVVQAYTRLAPALNDVGVSAQEQYSVVRLLGQALVISGASSSEAAAGMQQFAQAMASGVLQGDELRSLKENFPALARAIADGLGVSVGALRDMGAAGELTTQRVIGALTSMADKINADFGQMGQTAGGVFVQIQNQLFDVVGSLMQTTGATNEVVGAMQDLLAAVSSTEFKTAAGGAIGAVANTLADIVSGIAESTEQIRQIFGESSADIQGWKEQFDTVDAPLKPLADAFAGLFDHIEGGSTTAAQAFRGVGEAVTDTIPGVRDFLDFIRANAPWAADAVDGISESILGVSREARAAAEDLSRFYQAAIQGPKNFAGANGFRGAQDIGTENEVSRVSLAMQAAAFTSDERPKPVPSPFDPKPRPQEKADEAYGRKMDAAAKAGQRAMDEAARLYAADEKVVTDLLKQLSQAVGEREQFIQQATERLSGGATDEQVAKVRELASAEWDRVKAVEAATAKRQAQADMEKQALALNREHMSAADQFMVKMQQLDAMKSFGLSDAAYSAEAKAASEEAQRATEEANKATVENYAESYAEIDRLVQQTYQGISAGLSAMIVKGEADFATFVDGMAQSLLQSGLAALMGGVFGTPGQPGMLFGGGSTGGGGGILGIGAGGLTGGTSSFRYAHGAAFSGGNVIPFARGGIVDRPVVFPMAKGMGLMGEAGPEAVMPLRRLASGDLGVVAAAAPSQQAAPVVNITVVNQTRQPVTASSERDPQGNMRLVIREMVGADIATPGTPAHTAVRGIVARYGNGR